MEVIMQHLEEFAAAYVILGSTIGFFIKVYFVDIKGNTKSLIFFKKRLDKLENDMEDNTDNDLKVEASIQKELVSINRQLDHTSIVLELIADNQKIKVPKFVK